MNFIVELVTSVFRPSIVALSMSLAIAVISLDTDAHIVSKDTVSLGCNGLLNPVCRAFSF